VSAFKYDADTDVQNTIAKFVQFVEFDWRNVSMKLAESSPSDMTRRYFVSSNKQPLFSPTPPRRARTANRGWRKEWQGNTFEKCQIIP
jgi:hypothetical protein